VNALYYIGDSVSNEYENKEGGVDQRNDAHFVELASALAIVDFANIDKGYIQSANGKAINPVYKEFGVVSQAERLTFKDLFADTINLVRSNITEFFYFNLFLKEKLQSELSHPYASGYNNKIDKNFIDQSFYKTVSDFNKSFRIWLGEMHRNKVSFAPFNIEPETGNNKEVTDIKIGTSSIFTLVNDVREKKSWKHFVPGLSVNNYELFISNLNDAAEKIGNTSTNKRFMGVFSKASKEIVNQKLF
jgi:hypothetical protein